MSVDDLAATFLQNAPECVNALELGFLGQFFLATQAIFIPKISKKGMPKGKSVFALARLPPILPNMDSAQVA
ncbi:MAG TPA: hypothetical protein VM532_15040 [Burkholderiales bacterium]|nr:hypothetical protein [Burkholderiales bacterium]